MRTTEFVNSPNQLPDEQVIWLTNSNKDEMLRIMDNEWKWAIILVGRPAPTDTCTTEELEQQLMVGLYRFPLAI